MENYFRSILTSGLLLVCGLLYAQPSLPAGQPLLRQQGIANMANDWDSIGSVTIQAADTDSLVLRFTTQQQPRHIYSLSRRLPLRPGDLKEGQVLLLSFRAKTVTASLETGEAKLLFVLRQTDSHKGNIQKTLSIGSEWRTYHIPFVTTQRITAKDLGLSIQFGYPQQELLLSNLALTAYPAGIDQTLLPKTRINYPGQEAEAPWRQAAMQRIHRHRKGSFSLQFTDEEGEAIASTAISITQERHNFGWGAAVSASVLQEQPEHLERISDAFNIVVFENDLKIKRWDQRGAPENVLGAIQLLAERNIDIKGHVLIWPGFRYLLPVFRKWEDQPEKVTTAIDQHLDDILGRTFGLVSSWDVVNETYTNKDLQRITGSEDILYNGFHKLHALDSTVLRFTNEFGIISRGGHDSRKQEWYYDYIKRVDENTGGLVDGIGIQCHMGSDLTPPERVLELLDYYGELDKKISISEFTLDIDDPELRYDYTRDFIIAAFSHPKVSEFLFWGYYEPTHPKAAIFDANWQIGDMGLAFFSLVHQQWKTQLQTHTDPTGRVQGRGFYGTYRYTLEQEGQTRTGTFELLPGQPLISTIQLK